MAHRPLSLADSLFLLDAKRVAARFAVRHVRVRSDTTAPSPLYWCAYHVPSIHGPSEWWEAPEADSRAQAVLNLFNTLQLIASEMYFSPH